MPLTEDSCPPDRERGTEAVARPDLPAVRTAWVEAIRIDTVRDDSNVRTSEYLHRSRQGARYHHHEGRQLQRSPLEAACKPRQGMRFELLVLGRREHAVDFEHGRHAEPAGRRERRHVETGVPCVQEIGLEVLDRPADTDILEHVVAGSRALKQGTRQHGSDTFNEAMPWPSGSGRHDAADLYLMAQVTKGRHHRGNVDALGAVPEGTVVVQDAHVRR